LPVLAITLQAASTLQSDSVEVNQAAQRLLDAGAAGLSMALIDGSGMTWCDSRGFADIAAQSPMSTDTM
jgi:hypothetical protein